MKKILTVIGARPQFVKAAALSRALRKEGFKEVIVHTGQHFDANMSDVFFEEMEIPKPDVQLQIHSLGHGAMTGRMMEEIEKILLEEKPDLLMVYGDTNSTLAGALAAVKLHIPVAHIEAGLRSFNNRMPEEINRILTDRISEFLFCPTDTAIHNLDQEGYAGMTKHVVRSGDVMQDAAEFYAKTSGNRSNVISQLPMKDFALATLHRAENTDDPDRLKQLVEGLNEINSEQIPVVIPLHPRTKKKLLEHGLSLELYCLDPQGYFDMIELLKHCKLVLTDSGGLQKEAFFFRKPCVTMRDQTEWVELIDTGVNQLVGANREKLIQASQEMLKAKCNFNIDLYGNGRATESIAQYLKDHLY